MMNKEGKCATCEWFDKADGYVGQCCFLPPIPVHVPARHFHDDIGPRIDPARTDSAYPRVYADSQCGQWKAKLEALEKAQVAAQAGGVVVPTRADLKQGGGEG
jgi:hypothetical protein